MNSFDENASDRNQKLKLVGSKKKSQATKQKNANVHTATSHNSNGVSHMSRSSHLNHTRSSRGSVGRGRNGGVINGNDKSINSNNSSNNNNKSNSNGSSSRPSIAPPRTISRIQTQTQTFGQDDSTHSERKRSLSHTPQSGGNDYVLRPGEDYYGHKDDRHHHQTHRHQGDISTSVYDERQSMSSRGSGGSHDSHVSACASPHAPLSPSSHSIPKYSRYDEQLRNSLNRLGIESYSDVSYQGQHQLQHYQPVQASPNRRRSGDHPIALPMDRGSPSRPRSAPSSASASPLSARSGRPNVGDRGGGVSLGVGGDKDLRGGIAMARNGGGMRSAAVRSNSTGRMNMKMSINSSSDRIDMSADHAFDSHPPLPLPPQRSSGRPPIPVPTHSHLPPPPPPPYHPDPRAAPHSHSHSSMRDVGGRPLPLFSSLLVPSYSRM